MIWMFLLAVALRAVFFKLGVYSVVFGLRLANQCASEEAFSCSSVTTVSARSCVLSSTTGGA